MRPPLKLSSIDQEHLQELYGAAKINRDELPYSQAFDELCQGFQDRTFKNAHHEQIFGALIKYTRSSGNAATEAPASSLTDDQIKQLKALLPRHSKAGKVLPYSDEFENVLREFNKLLGQELTPAELWHALQRASGPKRRPPKRAKVAAVVSNDDDEDGE